MDAGAAHPADEPCAGEAASMRTAFARSRRSYSRCLSRYQKRQSFTGYAAGVRHADIEFRGTAIEAHADMALPVRLQPLPVWRRARHRSGVSLEPAVIS